MINQNQDKQFYFLDNFYTEFEQKIDEEHYIGKVGVFKATKEENFKSNDLKVYYVLFEKGSMTRIHYHQSDQILIAQHGEGFVTIINKIEIDQKDQTDNIKSEQTIELKPGNAILIRAGILHYHGAKKNKEFNHVAILQNKESFYL